MRWVIFCAIVMFSLLLIQVSYSDSSKVEDEVMNALQHDGEARVIVQLKEEVTSGYGILSTNTPVDTGEVVGEYKDEITVSHVYEVVNGFSGEIDLADLEKLRNDNRVERVYYDSPVYA